MRVRGYNQPGEDGLVGTADDPLFNNSYAACTITNDDRGLLHDAFAEAHGSSPLSIFMTPFSDCALPGISASSIANSNYSSGPDGKWFTADDVKGIEFTLSRTPTGSDLIFPTTPANTAINVYTSYFDNVIYNPYAGQDINVPYIVGNTYGYDASGRVKGLSQTGHQTLYELQSDGFIKTREIRPSAPTAPLGPIYLREEYEKNSSGKIWVHTIDLLSPYGYEFFTSSSPTGQILLQVLLGLSMPTGEKLLSLDGSYYYFATGVGLPHYEIEKTGERIDRIKEITSAGLDTVWHTDDDVVRATVVFSYGIAP